MDTISPWLFNGNLNTISDDRFVDMPNVTQLFSSVQTPTELPETILNQLEEFFKNYNEQAGKVFKVTARLNAKEAVKLLT